MTPGERLLAAFAEGIVRGVLASEAAAPHPAATVPAKRRSARRRSLAPRSGPPLAAREILPTPGYDPAGESQPLPGFEGIPPASLAQMEAAMAAVVRGAGPPPGHYFKDDVDTSVPLS